MKNNNVLLSICIPTNGVIEWVFPVLDSIYSQNVDDLLFEVVVTDNGNNTEFQSKILEYANKYKNLKYIKTNAFEFLNEIESYKLACGKFIKFINHRTMLKDGSLDYFINFVKDNQKEKPIVYFSNGELKLDKVLKLNTFDEYIKNLDIYSSWSTGMAFWKEHFDAMASHDNFNVLFPHTNILFDRKNESQYIIDDTCLLDEIIVTNKPKGKYDLFHAFAVEYVALLLDLYRERYISFKTFNFVRKQNLKFIKELYFDYVFRKKYCSYDISNFNNSIQVFYSKRMVKRAMFPMLIKQTCLKFIKFFKKKK